MSNYADLTVRELKPIITARGLSHRGKKKAELIAALEAYDADVPAEEKTREDEVQTFLEAKREYARLQAENFNRKFRR
jgi:hypothetical protein